MASLPPAPLTRGLYLNDAPAAVGFSGSGGKTTCGECLAQEATARGRSVVVTTTTKIRVPPQPLSPRCADDVRLALERAPEPLFVGEIAPDGRKMSGPPPALLEEMIAARVADLTVVEVDGSRGASVKGYRDDEPVLPRHLDRLCVVVGADAVGARRDSPLVHRDHLLWPRLRLRDETALGADDVARALLDQPSCLAAARRFSTTVLINKIDDDDSLRKANALADALSPHLESRGVVRIAGRGRALPDEVAVMWQRRQRREVHAVLLAAGRSTRFGSAKLVAPIDGTAVIAHALGALRASAVASITVVLGHAAEMVRAAAGEAERDARVRFVDNPRFEQGLSTSIAAGVAAAPDGDGLLLALGDMPFITPDTIARVLEAYASTPFDIVAPRHNGRRGHPVVLSRRFANGLSRLEGDFGAAPLLAAHAADLCLIDVEDPGVHRDIDVPSALEEVV